MCTCVCARARERKNTGELTCLCARARANFTSWPRGGCCSLPLPLISSSPPTLSSSLSSSSRLSRAGLPARSTTLAGITRDIPRAAASALAKSGARASAEHEARSVCTAAVIFLKDLSTGGNAGGREEGKRAGYGAEGSLCAAKGFLARGRRRKAAAAAAAALPTLETPRACFARILLRSVAVVLFSRKTRRDSPPRTSLVRARGFIANARNIAKIQFQLFTLSNFEHIILILNNYSLFFVFP